MNKQEIESKAREFVKGLTEEDQHELSAMQLNEKNVFGYAVKAITKDNGVADDPDKIIEGIVAVLAEEAEIAEKKRGEKESLNDQKKKVKGEVVRRKPIDFTKDKKFPKSMAGKKVKFQYNEKVDGVLANRFKDDIVPLSKKMADNLEKRGFGTIIK